MNKVTIHYSKNEAFELPDSAHLVKEYITVARNSPEAKRLWRAGFLAMGALASLGNAFSYTAQAFLEAALYLSDKPRAERIFKEKGQDAVRSVAFAVLGLFLALASLSFPHWAYAFVVMTSAETPPPVREGSSPPQPSDESLVQSLVAQNTFLEEENKRLNRLLLTHSSVPQVPPPPVQAERSDPETEAAVLESKIIVAVEEATKPLREELQQQMRENRELKAAHQEELAKKEARIKELVTYEVRCKRLDRFSSQKEG